MDLSELSQSDLLIMAKHSLEKNNLARMLINIIMNTFYFR